VDICCALLKIYDFLRLFVYYYYYLQQVMKMQLNS
jgi:hypothetical protein